MISIDTNLPVRKLYANRAGLKLSDVELTIARLSAHGFTVPQIARALGRQVITISKHRTSICAKINARNMMHAVHLLTARGVLKE